MNSKPIIWIVISAVVGAVSATAVNQWALNTSQGNGSTQVNLVQQLEQLQVNLDKERSARLKLEESIVEGRLTVGNPSTSTVSGIAIEQERDPSTDELVTEEILIADQTGAAVSVPDFDAQRVARLQSEYKKQQLIDAGFSNADASWVVQAESEVVLEQLFEQHRRQRLAYQQSTEGESNPLPTLRDKLGDEYYQRYLEANGRPTSALIGSVMAGTPGEAAGLRAGDNIVSYDGQRVFNLQEVNQLTVRGEEGSSVLLEVERDGEPMQLAIPRGPIGITSGRSRFRR